VKGLLAACFTQEGLAENAGYNESVLKDLSEDLDIDYSTLRRCIKFFKVNNVATSSHIVSWSHYKYLLALPDSQERQWYEDLIENEDLNVLQLSQAIKGDRYAWFKNKNKKSGLKSPALKLTRPVEPTYVYKAIVKRVVDGDTLLLLIDLGFQVWKEQRIRLAGIDTPALDEAGGQEAFHFVRDQLAKVKFVMLKTGKIDIYGRYVGDVFYSLKTLSKDRIFKEGRYLNQEILDKGLARLY